MLGAGALGRPRGMVWGGWEEGGFRMGSMRISEIKKNKKRKKKKRKLNFLCPVATGELCIFFGILSAARSQHHLLGVEIAQLEFHHLH